jgi:probable HAF family extracellular repeat protein
VSFVLALIILGKGHKQKNEEELFMKMKIFLLSLFCAIFLIPNAWATSYKMIDLGTLYGGWGVADDINNSGQIVGWTDAKAFLYENGTMTDLGTLGGFSSRAQAINESGLIAGFGDTVDAVHTAIVYENGEMIDIGTPSGWAWSDAFGINEMGQVVGRVSVRDDYHASLYENGVLIDLGTLGGTWSWAWSINNHGQVVGYSAKPNSVTHAFIYENGTMTDLASQLGDENWASSAFDINDKGQIVGGLGQTAMLLDLETGSVTLMEPFAGNISYAMGINEAGQVVGYSTYAGGGSWDYHAFLYENGTMTDLGTLVGGTESRAYAINDHGEIVGDAHTIDGVLHPVLWVPDGDGDGYFSDEDCDDTDATIYPGACDIKNDGIDQDCDGQDRRGGKPCTDEPADTGKKEGKGRTCTDGIDNDLDGLIDCSDPDCSKNKACL